MKTKLLLLLCTFFCLCFSLKAQDTVISIPEVTISSDVKLYDGGDSVAFLSQKFGAVYLNRHNVKDFKDFSSLSAGLHIPDYGSKITSTIYMRGIGSRIDNSSVGVSIDGVMMLNKNCFDFSYFDLASVSVLKGPQALLYGMNSMAGLIDVRTLSPFDFFGLKTSLSIGNGNSYALGVSYYGRIGQSTAILTAIDASSTQGFFDNSYNGKNVDWERNVNLRNIVEYRSETNWTLKNSLFFSYLHQGGYAYCLTDTNDFSCKNVDYDEPSGYDRYNLIDNFSATYIEKGSFRLQSLSSLQLNFDKMYLDNDFTSDPYFVLTQKQKDYGFSQEIVLKDDRPLSRFHWKAGLFGFYKYLNMQAPVVFKQVGLQRLILDNINNGMHNSGVFTPNDSVSFRQHEMRVKDEFKYPRFGSALYTELSYDWWKLSFVFGLRLDYEKVLLDYLSSASVDYLFNATMQDYVTLDTKVSGKTNRDYCELLPKFALLYKTSFGNLFASVGKGYMTGGYNTQMFADIIRNEMQQNMMSSLGITPDEGGVMQDVYSSYNKDDILYYKPEYMWNYELGAHLRFFDNKLQINTSVFYSEISQQQITVFASPMTTGRMMTNAARSRSIGVEFSSSLSFGNFDIMMSYCYTNAKYKQYNDNKADYKDKYLAYYPLNTFNIGADYTLLLYTPYLDKINFALSYTGTGKIYFNNSNTLCEPYYNIVDLDISFQKQALTLGLWARNVLDTDYNTFYFLSTGNNFVSKGKPLNFGFVLRYNW